LRKGGAGLQAESIAEAADESESPLKEATGSSLKKNEENDELDELTFKVN
jgi:hypothetical protein